YEWIWWKNQATQMMNAQYRPLSEHEDILVFSEMRLRSNQFVSEKMTYNPQGIISIQEWSKGKNQATAINNLRGNINKTYLKTLTNFPKTVLAYDVEVGLHPTQKPLSLYEYLIRTYTQPGELVLDFCAGSGTTGRAAQLTNRNFILGDSSPEYCDIARKRLSQAYTLPMFEPIPQAGD